MTSTSTLHNHHHHGHVLGAVHSRYSPISSPLTPDALNRFRMTHSDREVRSLVKRLNRLPVLPADDDQPLEEQAARLEVDKWQFGVERHLASVRNLERQARSYESRAAQTRSRNDELKATLEEEKKLLAQGMAERDQRIKCDEVAKRIQARGRTRAELEEWVWIASLTQANIYHRGVDCGAPCKLRRRSCSCE